MDAFTRILERWAIVGPIALALALFSPSDGRLGDVPFVGAAVLNLLLATAMLVRLGVRYAEAAIWLMGGLYTTIWAAKSIRSGFANDKFEFTPTLLAICFFFAVSVRAAVLNRARARLH